MSLHDGLSFPRALGLWALIAALALFLSAPDRLLEPQLWGEDGTVYLRTAYEMGGWDSMLIVHWAYYLLWPRLAAVFAVEIAGLDHAPLWMLLAGLTLQVFAIGMILSSAVVRSLPVILRIGLLVVLTSSYVAGEVTFVACHAQFHLALLSIFMIGDLHVSGGQGGPTKGQRRAQRWAMVLISTNGALASALAPFYIGLAAATRQREAWRWAIIAACGALLQGGVFLYVKMIGSIEFAMRGERGTFLDALHGACATLFLRPILGPFGSEVSSWVISIPPEQRLLLLIALNAVGAALVALLVLWRKSYWPLMLCGVLVALILIAAQLGPSARYAYIPTAFLYFAFSLRAVECWRGQRWRAIACGTVAVAMFAHSAIGFRSPAIPPVQRTEWSAELARWREDPSQPLRILPYPWQFSLFVRGSKEASEARWTLEKLAWFWALDQRQDHVLNVTAIVGDPPVAPLLKLSAGVDQKSPRLLLRIEGARPRCRVAVFAAPGLLTPRKVPGIGDDQVVHLNPSEIPEDRVARATTDELGVATLELPISAEGLLRGAWHTVQAAIVEPPISVSNALIIRPAKGGG